MHWQEICENPLLKNLPFKIETNKWGKLEMSPASNEHGLYQSMIIKLMFKLAIGGDSLTECSIQTSEGVKVADVAWGTYDFFKRNGRANPYLESPEIVVEILSHSNTRQEMTEKKELYFARGAKEFWMCDRNGTVSFFSNNAELLKSQIIAEFPTHIVIDFA